MNSSGDEEQDKLNKLAKITNIKTMYTFPITYNRHHGRYGKSEGIIQPSYQPRSDPRTYVFDPDWFYKIDTKKLKIKRGIFLLLLALYLLRKREE